MRAVFVLSARDKVQKGPAAGDTNSATARF